MTARAPDLVAACDAGAQTLRERIIAAEDARVATDSAIAPILEGLGSTDPSTAALAARALGRFERPAFVQHLLPVLGHNRADVRREAANALGQSLVRIPAHRRFRVSTGAGARHASAARSTRER